MFKLFLVAVYLFVFVFDCLFGFGLQVDGFACNSVASFYNSSLCAVVCLW